MFKPLVVTALVLACGLAAAQQPAAPGAGHGEHQARHAEWKAKADARFAEADKDKDGRLDKVEIQSFGPRGDRMAKHFDRMDANSDGELDRDELAKAHRQMRRGGKAMRGHMQFQRGLFVGMDDDADGAISRAELGNKVPKWVENFGTIDANADGKLSKEELRQYHRAAMQARRAERES